LKTDTSGQNYRTVSIGCGGVSNPPCPSPAQGWYIDLPTSGERTVGSPQMISNTIFFDTFIPSTTPCDYGGTGWLMAVNYATGGVKAPDVFDTHGATGVQIGGAIGGTTIVKNSGTSVSGNRNRGVGISSLTTGATNSTGLNLDPSPGSGRETWREIFQ
jgi:type IV pilus assembly protein PilY1